MTDRALILLRHGRTAHNASGRFQGQLDVPLDPVGVEQAMRAAAALAALRPTTLVSSDSERAAATAVPVSDACGLPLVTDPRLREIDIGHWAGLTGADVAARFPDEYAAWRAGLDLRRGEGETYAEVAERGVACLAPLLDALPPRGLLIAVTHGGTARAITARLIGLPSDHWNALGGLANCTWALLRERPPGWRLYEYGRAAC